MYGQDAPAAKDAIAPAVAGAIADDLMVWDRFNYPRRL
jgi:hypothetical protein